MLTPFPVSCFCWQLSTAPPGHITFEMVHMGETGRPENPLCLLCPNPSFTVDDYVLIFVSSEFLEMIGEFSVIYVHGPRYVA